MTGEIFMPGPSEFGSLDKPFSKYGAILHLLTSMTEHCIRNAPIVYGGHNGSGQPKPSPHLGGFGLLLFLQLIMITN